MNSIERACAKCGATFTFSGTGRRVYCSDCKKQYDKDYWTKTKDRRHSQKKMNRAEIKRRNFEFVMDFLRHNPCVDCGEDDLVVLEFDHLDPKKKRGNIATMMDRCVSLTTLQAEINKCQAVCANCHRRRTAKTFDWRRGRVIL